VLWGVAGRAVADTKAELVSTALVWDRANHVTNPDLVRFGDRWFLACQESATPDWPGGTIRVLTSADGKAWESVALIESPTPKRGLYTPTFALTPDGRLMVSAVGFLPYPNVPNPLPKYGGMLKTMAWFSKDGREWGKPVPISPDEFPFNRIVWHNGTAFGCAQGRICGSAQTIRIMSSKDGEVFESRATKTFSGFMPHEGELLFEGDMAYYLVTGPAGLVPGGRLGTAKAPYEKWEWKELDQQVRHVKFLRLPDKRVIAAVGLHDDRKVRTSLCEFHPATGKFIELLELPAGKQAVATGLAWHDGHLWTAYPVTEKDRLQVHLAKVKLR
jgi:hypothetical protein